MKEKEESEFKDNIVMRDAGLIRSILRVGMRAISSLFPKTPTVRQTKYFGLPIVVWANEYIGRRILISGRFEEDEIRQFSNFVRSGDVCIDVGANIGTHTVVLAKLAGADGKVFAFEPNRRNSLLIEINALINDLANVTVECRPVSDKAGKTMIKASGDQDSCRDYYSDVGSHSNAGVNTQPNLLSITLDDFCRDMRILPNFIKIDVEGAELSVLKGAYQTLSISHDCCVMVEVVGPYLARFNNSVEELFSYMASTGYTPNVMRGKSLVNIEATAVLEENVFFIKGNRN